MECSLFGDDATVDSHTHIRHIQLLLREISLLPIVAHGTCSSNSNGKVNNKVMI